MRRQNDLARLLVEHLRSVRRQRVERVRIEMEALTALTVDLEQTGFTDLEVDGILREMQDVDFEDFFIEPVQKPAERAQQEPSPQRDEEGEVRQPASESPAKRIKCPHCGAWIDL